MASLKQLLAISILSNFLFAFPAYACKEHEEQAAKQEASAEDSSHESHAHENGHEHDANKSHESEDSDEDYHKPIDENTPPADVEP